MRTLFVVCLSLSVIALSSIYKAEAESSNSISNTKPIGSQMSADLLEGSYVSQQPYSKINYGKDTVAMQNKVLEKINEALVRGVITPQEASDLKGQLNTLGERESWYKSDGVPVPAAVLEDNVKKIAALDKYIDKKLPLKLNAVTNHSNAGFEDVRQLIGRALAKNKITNSQAEQYYSQLAEIENDAEGLKNDPAGSNSEFANLHERLQLLKADIQSKAK